MKSAIFGGWAAVVFLGVSYPGEQDNAYIKEIQVRPNRSVLVIMETPRTSFPYSGNCIDTVWHRTHWAISPSVNPNYHEVLAVLMTAKSNESPVRVVGVGSCAALATVETIESVTLK